MGEYSDSITTVDGLVALPVGSVVLDRDGDVWVRADGGMLWVTGAGRENPYIAVVGSYGPLRPIHIPGALDAIALRASRDAALAEAAELRERASDAEREASELRVVAKSYEAERDEARADVEQAERRCAELAGVAQRMRAEPGADATRVADMLHTALAMLDDGRTVIRTASRREPRGMRALSASLHTVHDAQFGQARECVREALRVLEGER